MGLSGGEWRVLAMPEVGPAQPYMEDRIHIPGSSPVSRGKKSGHVYMRKEVYQLLKC